MTDAGDPRPRYHVLRTRYAWLCGHIEWSCVGGEHWRPCDLTFGARVVPCLIPTARQRRGRRSARAVADRIPLPTIASILADLYDGKPKPPGKREPACCVCRWWHRADDYETGNFRFRRCLNADAVADMPEEGNGIRRDEDAVRVADLHSCSRWEAVLPPARPGAILEIIPKGDFDG